MLFLAGAGDAQKLVTATSPWGGGVAPRPYGGGRDPAFTFIRASGSRFADASGAPFYFLGANYWAGMSLGAADRERLRADLDALKAAGVTQLRVLGAAEGPDSEPWRIAPSLTPCPGVYNAAVLEGFDFLIAEMGARRMRATVVLGDEWAWTGGHVQYVRWAQALATANITADSFSPNASACVPTGVDAATGAPRRPDITNASWRELGFQGIPYPGPGGRSWSDYQALAGEFYGLPIAQRLWRDHVAFMVSHVNVFTGLAARDDPTVMSWQLANEPRAADTSLPAAATQFLDWLRSSAAFIKQLAPAQMVSSGMGACMCSVAWSLFALTHASLGSAEADTSYWSPAQSLLRSNNATGLDYVTAHLWVQNWGLYAPGFDDSSLLNTTVPFARAYVAASVAQAAALNLPVVLEEFGFPRDRGSLAAAAPVTRRDAYFAVVFDALLASAASSGALAGVNFWAYAGRGRPAAANVPATATDLCGAGAGGAVTLNFSAPPPATLTGAPPDWAACFADQGGRQNTCGRDTWWAVREAWPPGAYVGQDAFLGDPPHESQGWYSIYDTDPTMQLVRAYAGQLNATLACAAAAVRSAADVAASPGAQAGAVACTAAIPPGRNGNLCPA